MRGYMPDEWKDILYMNFPSARFPHLEEGLTMVDLGARVRLYLLLFFDAW